MVRRPRLALVASLCVVVFASACQFCPLSGVGAPKTVALAVRVHAKSQLSAAEADDIVKTSSTILQVADSTGDTACNVQLSIASLDNFDIGTGVIYSQTDFDALFGPTSAQTLAGATPTQVRVVSEIYWCGAIIASAAGCADQPGTRMAVARRGSDREGELWAHEVGHTRGLPHRNFLLAVMYATVLPNHKEVNNVECTAFRQ